MKYYINKNRNQVAWISIALAVLVPLGAVALYLWMRRLDFRLLYCCFVLVPIDLIVCFLDRRAASYVKIAVSTIDSFSMFGKKYCSVLLDQPVYFISFETYIAETKFKGANKPFIALSNQPFTYYNPAKVVNFIVRYDLHKIVVLPYDERTTPLLPTEHWIRVI